MYPIHPLLISFVAVLATALFSGCSTTEGTVGKVSAEALAPEIDKGSLVEDLVAAYGPPARIESAENSPEPIDLWIYNFKKSQTEFVTIGSVDIPFVDPITGEMGSIEEPVYRPQTTTRENTVIFYVQNGMVLGWKGESAERRDIAE